MISCSALRPWLVAALLLVLATAILPSAGAQDAASPAPAATAGSAFDSWPEYPFRERHTIDRGPGFYFHSVKLILLALVFFGWIRTTEWVSLDLERSGLPHQIWTPANFFPFLLGFFIFGLWLPIFFLGFLLLLACWLGPLGAYIHQRNEKVRPSEQIFTADWFRGIATNPMVLFGAAPIEAKPRYSHEEGPPVVFTGLSAANDQLNQANTILARQSPGYITAKELFVDAVGRRTEKIVLDYTQQAVAVKYQIDGVLFDAAPRDRESGDVLLAVLKKLANCDINDRVKRQQGRFLAEHQGKKYPLDFASSGTPTGERAVITFPPQAFDAKNPVDLGMREKMAEQVKELLGHEKGLVVFSAMPAGGLTTTLSAVLRSQDRYMRDFVAIDDVRRPEPEVENVPVQTYDSAAGETAMKLIPTLIRKLPNVLLCRELADGQSYNTLCEEMHSENVLIVTTIRAKEAPEAVLRILALKVQPKLLSEAILGVVNQRLIRKLCDSCKEAYAPTPELLQKLGIPAGRIQALYRERQPPKVVDPNQPPPEPCQTCGGIGYFGRTAIYELLPVDDTVRQAILKAPTIENLRAAGRKAGWRSLQEEGIVLVAKGTTSISELQRVLKT